MELYIFVRTIVRPVVVRSLSVRPVRPVVSVVNVVVVLLPFDQPVVRPVVVVCPLFVRLRPSRLRPSSSVRPSLRPSNYCLHDAYKKRCQETLNMIQNDAWSVLKSFKNYKEFDLGSFGNLLVPLTVLGLGGWGGVDWGLEGENMGRTNT